jgi:hypothetical protein
MRTLLRFVALAAALALATTTSAQTLVGSVEGVVKDEQDSAVPGASVSLIGKSGTRSATTGSDGAYRFAGVDPGTYSVQVALPGFQTVRHDNVVVIIAKTAIVDVGLKVRAMTDEVSVTAEAPLVDTTASNTDNTLSQDLLFNLPIRPVNAATGMMNYTPGVNSQAAFGGDGSTGNALLLDGVDTRDPGFGSAWTFFNFNIVEQVQISGLGAQAEYGGFTGVVVNTVSRSGGNRTSGLFDGIWTNKSLGSRNVSDESARANPSLGDPARTKKLLDYTAQISGPIKQDKAFYFLSAQRYQLNVEPSGAPTYRDEVSRRFNGKLTFNATQNDQLTATLQFDDYNIRGRCDLGAFVCTDPTLNDEDAPEWVWLGQWRHLFSSSTFLEAKYTGWWGYFYLDPVVNASGHGDLDGSRTVSQGWTGYNDRTRHQFNAALSHYADKFGRHDFKFGVEVERSTAHDRFGYLNDAYFYDYYGSPYYAWAYSYDYDSKNERLAAYAQDRWKIDDRLTLNLGVRMDHMRGGGKGLGRDAGTVYEVTGIAPRLGFALDLTRDGRTVVKGSWGQYYEGIFSPIYNGALGGESDFVTWDVTGCSTTFDNGCPRSAFVEVDRVPAPVYRIDPDIKHPRQDEFTAGIERAIGGELRVSLTGIYRDLKNIQGSVIPSARYLPVSVPNGLTGGNLTVYRWTNRSASQNDLLLTNPDGFQFRDASGNVFETLDAKRTYKALMAVVNKRMSNRWQAQVSYVLSKTEGLISNGSLASAGAKQFFENPNDAGVNAFGPALNDRTHEFKLLAQWEVPVVDFSIGAYYRYLSGRTYAAHQQLSGTQLPGFASSVWRRPFLEPRGSRRLPAESLLDLRLEKVFRIGANDRIAIYSDITNVFNKEVITAVQERYPQRAILGPGGSNDVAFGAPATIFAPRQVQIGARWSF